MEALQNTLPHSLLKDIKILYVHQFVKHLKGAPYCHHWPGPSVQIFEWEDCTDTEASAGTSRLQCDCLWRDCRDFNPRPSPVSQSVRPLPSLQTLLFSLFLFLGGPSLKTLVVPGLTDPWDCVQQQPAVEEEEQAL